MTRSRRVVVTGLGLITPLGSTVPTTWSRLVSGHSAVDTLPPAIAGTGPRELPCKVAALVDRTALDEAQWLSNPKAQSSGFISFALGAAREALRDAQWPVEGFDPQRSGVAIGSGIGGAVEEVRSAAAAFEGERGLRRVSPFFVPRLLINQAAGHVSIAHNLQGPNHSAVTACASGAHSIGDAARLIEYGDADVMVAGGTESTVDPLSLGGFARIKALSTRFNDRPHAASRPFDRERDGFVMGEGAGVVVLEEAEHARKRGANVYAEVVGYGLSGDAFHLTAPSDDGRGAIACMRKAMEHAGLRPEDIDYINAHATSTPKGDAIENHAIATVLSSVAAESVCVSSTKGAIGHLLGAAGAVEAIFTILAVKHDLLPPTINLDTPDEGFAFDYVAHQSKQKTVNAALSNSFGFGGTNTCLAFQKWSESE